MDGSGEAGQPVASEQPYLSLYRRFRPGRFEELRGQPHVVRAVRSAVRDGHVAHAYLFSGPRGTGKTSTARILAKALNCAQPLDGEPCGVCASCLEITRGSSLDVHELDAASNNGVDAMRDLIAHAALGTPGRWKVYIVDEVHMLSNAAANALLKTLEEPPGHVIFVLATTDPQKVPPTLRSRTQQFEFHLLPGETLAELLRDVNREAGLELGDEALSLAVRRARGSARDALSALDQVAAAGTTEDARPELGRLIEFLAEEDAAGLLVVAAELHEAGWGAQQLASELVDELRQAFLVALAPALAAADDTERARLEAQAARLGLPRLVRAMETLGRAQVDMREAPDARVVLEVALVRLARPELDESTGALGDRLAKLEAVVAQLSGGGVRSAPPRPEPLGQAPGSAPDPADQPSIGAIRRARPSESKGREVPPEAPAPATQEEGPAMSAAPAPVEVPAPAVSRAPEGGPDRDTLVEAWGDHVLRSLPARAKAVYSPGRFTGVDPGESGPAAVFALPNAAHRDRAEEVRPIVEGALEGHFGRKIALRLVVDHEPGTASPARSGRPGPSGDPPEEGPVGLAPDDDFDPDDPGDPAAVESVAESRVLKAFPGAQEV